MVRPRDGLSAITRNSLQTRAGLRPRGLVLCALETNPGDLVEQRRLEQKHWSTTVR
jgi:hypothetical protein